MNVHVEALRDDAPALIGLHQGQIVGEVARRDRAVDRGECGMRARLMDRDDAVPARQPLAGRRLPARDPVEVILPRPVGHRFPVGEVKMRAFMEHSLELGDITVVEAVEIVLKRCLDGGNAGVVECVRHDPSSSSRRVASACLARVSSVHVLLI